MTILLSPWTIISELLNAEVLREKGKRTGDGGGRGGTGWRRGWKRGRGGEDEQSRTVGKRVELEHREENSRTEAHSPLQHRARGQPEATPRVSRATQTS